MAETDAQLDYVAERTDALTDDVAQLKEIIGHLEDNAEPVTLWDSVTGIQDTLDFVLEKLDGTTKTDSDGSAAGGESVSSRLARLDTSLETISNTLDTIKPMATGIRFITLGSVILNVVLLGCVIALLFQGMKAKRDMKALSSEMNGLRTDSRNTSAALADISRNSISNIEALQRDIFGVRSEIVERLQSIHQETAVMPPQTLQTLQTPPIEQVNVAAKTISDPQRIDEIAQRIRECLTNKEYPMGKNPKAIFDGCYYCGVCSQLPGIDGRTNGLKTYKKAAGTMTDFVAIDIGKKTYLARNNPHSSYDSELFDHTGAFKMARGHWNDDRFILDEKGSY